MKEVGEYILTINGGSSSVKFALYSRDSFNRLLCGKIDRIGLSRATIAYTDALGQEVVKEVSILDYKSAIEILKSFAGEHFDFNNIVAIGHRVVHGMNRKKHTVVTNELIAELKEASAIDPEHLPFEIALIEMFALWQPAIPQVACFDTVFHSEMPRVARVLPIPRRFLEKGIQRYGFHGLSYSYIMDALRALDSQVENKRIIIAHLGSGASITAIKDGKSVDTSMGFSPAGGIPMSTRTGDVDPSVLLRIMKEEKHSLCSMNRLINHESGLLGISETSSNMHDLLESENDDERAKEAVDLFCYEVKKKIGAYVAVLGGLDMLVFTGGMGENAPRIRNRICAEMDFFGLILDEERNKNNNEIISATSGSVCVRVMKTNEEVMIARIADGLVNK